MQMASMAKSPEEAAHFRGLATVAESIKRVSDAKMPTNFKQWNSEQVNIEVVRQIVQVNCKEAEN